jgi:glutamyl-tRNA synthetase
LLATIVSSFDGVKESDWQAEVLHDAVEAAMVEAGLGIGKIMPQLRLAVSGSASGPDLFPMIELLGKDTVCRRLTNAPALISASQNPE